MSCNGQYRNGFSNGLFLYDYPYETERYERYERVERRNCHHRNNRCGFYGPYGPYVPYENGYYGAFAGVPVEDYYYNGYRRHDRCCDRRDFDCCDRRFVY